ncbi:hypothetical protein SO694_00050142 [Aureococcus anophagefferens]|uniref:Cleavage/polyadenylation specificity factor A subunit C-terminal domain-containing protein n=1 Tax=Aureococcus anophagefferens TaxID=44056 RepID=A0ABR1FYN7_AURAN
MFVHGDVLLLYGSAELDYEDEDEEDDALLVPRRLGGATVALAFDVSDRENPVLLRRQIFEGRYVTARKVGDFAYLVASVGLSAPSTKTVLANRAADSAVYCSKENLYLAQTEWTEGDGETYYRTAIVRLALDGADVAYAASYAAPGTLLNQFSLSESALDGTLAPGESIKSARFTATRGYLVTFAQTDPLFTISLDDPADPYVMGELKIPGYSAYLHPINASHMLGVAVVEVGDRGSASEALNDHKAFQFWSAGDLRARARPVDGRLRLARVAREPRRAARARGRRLDGDEPVDVGAHLLPGPRALRRDARPVSERVAPRPGFFDPVYDDAYDYWRTYRNPTTRART